MPGRRTAAPRAAAAGRELWPEFRAAARMGRFALVAALAAGLSFPATAAGTGYVFVSNEKSDTVTVLDPARDHAIAKQIATCQRPRDTHFDETRAQLYVACGDSDGRDRHCLA